MLEIIFCSLASYWTEKNFSVYTYFRSEKEGILSFPPQFLFAPPPPNFPHFLLFSRESYFHKILEEEEGPDRFIKTNPFPTFHFPNKKSRDWGVEELLLLFCHRVEMEKEFFPLLFVFSEYGEF